MINTVITGSGSYLPDLDIENAHFIDNNFCLEDGRRIQKDNQGIIDKFQEITGIKARKYVRSDQTNSEIAIEASRQAISDSGVDKDSIDTIIVAHNFGDVHEGSNQIDMLPNIASRVKNGLGIKNENCIPYDLIFGCPGWVQGLIQAHIFIKSGEANKCLVIGTETLSRVVDPFDRDSMIFADGAGAVILEGKEETSKRGVLAYSAVSHTEEELSYLKMGPSFNNFDSNNTHYIKMKGNKIYQYALTQVPKAIKSCLDKAGMSIDKLDKLLIHQANEKMDEAIVKRLYRLYGKKEVPENIMPMIIQNFGNSSVATVPTLYDLIQKGRLSGHNFNTGDHILFASVGAGMTINAVIYKYE